MLCFKCVVVVFNACRMNCVVDVSSLTVAWLAV